MYPVRRSRAILKNAFIDHRPGKQRDYHSPSIRIKTWRPTAGDTYLDSINRYQLLHSRQPGLPSLGILPYIRAHFTMRHVRFHFTTWNDTQGRLLVDLAKKVIDQHALSWRNFVINSGKRCLYCVEGGFEFGYGLGLRCRRW
jgi:hypothetical protein